MTAGWNVSPRPAPFLLPYRPTPPPWKRARPWDRLVRRGRADRPLSAPDRSGSRVPPWRRRALQDGPKSWLEGGCAWLRPQVGTKWRQCSGCRHHRLQCPDIGQDPAANAGWPIGLTDPSVEVTAHGREPTRSGACDRAPSVGRNELASREPMGGGLSTHATPTTS